MLFMALSLVKSACMTKGHNEAPITMRLSEKENGMISLGKVIKE